MSRRTAGLPPRDPAKAVEAAVAGAEREERLFSLRKAAVLLGRNRETLSRWADKEGMPVDRSGDTIRVDLAEVVKWIEERAVLKEREKWSKTAPTAEGLTERPMDPGDMLKLEQVKLTRIKIGREAEILIPRVAAEGAYQRALGLVRQSVMSVPERIVREMGGYPVDQVREWRLKAIEQCRSALQEAEKAIRSVMPDFEIGP